MTRETAPKTLPAINYIYCCAQVFVFPCFLFYIKSFFFFSFFWFGLKFIKFKLSRKRKHFQLTWKPFSKHFQNRSEITTKKPEHENRPFNLFLKLSGFGAKIGFGTMKVLFPSPIFVSAIHFLSALFLAQFSISEIWFQRTVFFQVVQTKNQTHVFKKP